MLFELQLHENKFGLDKVILTKKLFKESFKCNNYG